jgi:hypothetical protein
MLHSKFQKDDNGNPLLQRDRRNAKSSGFTVRGTAFADLNPIDGLVMTSRSLTSLRRPTITTMLNLIT